MQNFGSNIDFRKVDFLSQEKIFVTDSPCESCKDSIFENE